MVERVGNNSVCVCTLWNLEDFGLGSDQGLTSVQYWVCI